MRDLEQKRAYMREYRKRKPHIAKAEAVRNHQYYLNYWKSNHRKRHLKRFFDLTPEQYTEMLESQNGVCSICKQPENGKSLAVDHCHKTGEIRGLLCGKCNRGLGFFNDSKHLLSRAMEYLCNSNAQPVETTTK
jgi:hypothetical protein